MTDDKAIDWGKFEVAASPTPAPAPQAAASPLGAATPAATPAAAVPRDTVVVHCPNGHRLVVPASHAGKMGKCAKCQTAFRIPAAGESKPPSGTPSAAQHVDAKAPAEAPVARPADVGHGGPVAAAPAAPVVHEMVEPAAVATEQGAAIVDHSGPAPSIAGLLMRLWEEVERGGVVELHIDGGSVILPKWFERRLSSGTHALFASQAVDGTVTLTAVAWDSIQRIVVRNVGDLPDGMFD